MAAFDVSDPTPSLPERKRPAEVSIPRLLWLLVEGGWRDLARAIARHQGLEVPGSSSGAQRIAPGAPEATSPDGSPPAST